MELKKNIYIHIGKHTFCLLSFNFFPNQALHEIYKCYNHDPM